MWIPYMGSKSKSAIHIFNVINAFTKDRKENLLVELFTWWFAVWEVFLSKWFKVIANDKNKYVIALLDEVINKKLNETKCLEWVSREKFKDILQNKDKYEEWYVWYVMQIWSFWNNQKGYLFGGDNEIKKYSLYQLVVNKKVDDFVKSIMPQKYIDWIIKQDNWHKRRMALKKVLWVLKNRKDFQSLESLERLESLQRLDKVTFSSVTYEEVEIPEEAIVYCDPPYKWTATYAEWWFNYDKFWEYIRKLSKTNKVFVSEYNAPNDFRCIYEFSQKSTLQWWNQTHNNQPNEKVFVYNLNS